MVVCCTFNLPFKFFSDMQRNVGCGEQMAKMTLNDIETRLGIKDPMHRKKLFLAMTARQVRNLSSNFGPFLQRFVENIYLIVV